MPTYLLTGVAGFLGSHLAERLLAAGHRVRGVDCLRDYYSPALKRFNLEGLVGQPSFENLELDLATAELSPLLDGCDGVFHLAAQAGVRSSWGQEFHCYTRDNVLATQRLFEACRGRCLERVVYASSSSVYGDAQTLPTGEDAELRPISPYGVSKLAVENLARVYHDSFGVPAVGLRYFTVYGPRQRPDMAFHRFLRRALQEQAIPVYGPGQQTRDFTYVDDAVEATIAAMVRGVQGRVYNIGGGEPTTLARTLEILEEKLGRPIRREHLEAQTGDVEHTSARTALARQDLGYDPQIGMQEGLGRMVAWFTRVWQTRPEMRQG
jgi:nucleoside-diphosphate-sugar epimerase